MIIEILVGAAALSIIPPAITSANQMKKIGMVSESILGKEKGMFSSSVVYMALAETPAVFGLLVSILILMNLVESITLFQSYAILSAAIATASAGFFSAWGIGISSLSAIAAVSKKRNLFSRTLIFTTLPGTISIYGLLISLLIIFSLTGITTMDQVGKVFFASIIIGLISVVAYFLGQLGVKAINSMLENEKTFGPSLIIAALPESIAIYGLLVSIMILTGI